jgi:hypothetical protein
MEMKQGKPARTQVPVLRDEGGGDLDDEQVVGVGEEPHPGYQHRPQMEPAQRRLIQRCEQVLDPISVTASPPACPACPAADRVPSALRKLIRLK